MRVRVRIRALIVVVVVMVVVVVVVARHAVVLEGAHRQRLPGPFQRGSHLSDVT